MDANSFGLSSPTLAGAYTGSGAVNLSTPPALTLLETDGAGAGHIVDLGAAGQVIQVDEADDYQLYAWARITGTVYIYENLLGNANDTPLCGMGVTVSVYGSGVALGTAVAPLTLRPGASGAPTRLVLPDSFPDAPGVTRLVSLAAGAQLLVTPQFHIDGDWHTQYGLSGVGGVQLARIAAGVTPVAGAVQLGDQRSGVRDGRRTIAGRTTAAPPGVPAGTGFADNT